MAAFATPIPAEILPPLRTWEVPAPAASEASFDPAIWDGGGDASATPALMPGEAIIEEYATWVDEAFARPLSVASTPAERSPEAVRAAGAGAGAGVLGSTLGDAEPTTPAEVEPADVSINGAAEPSPASAPGASILPFAAEWASVRDANIRPYGEWRAAETVSLPVMPRAQAGAGARVAAPGQANGHAGGNGAGPAGGNGGGAGQQPRGGNRAQGSGQAQAQAQGADAGRGGRRRGRRPGGGSNGGGNGGGFGRDRDRGDRSERNGRFRDRGPRLPGFYNPGGD
jgi:hypothetical protein